MKEKKELRHKTYSITLTNQNIIELCYATRDAEAALKNYPYDVETNCVSNCVDLCLKLLSIADKKYLKLHQHKEIVKYYNERGAGK